MIRIKKIDKIIDILKGSNHDDGYILFQIRNDVEKLGFDVAIRYAKRFSPSKLGRLGYLGLRKLAKIRRDHPEFFKKIMKAIKEDYSNEP